MKLCLQCTPHKKHKKNQYVQTITKTAKWIKGNPRVHGLPPNRKSPSHPSSLSKKFNNENKNQSSHQRR